MRISDWSSDVCSSDLLAAGANPAQGNADGQTALHLAAMGKDQYWLDQLLERGVGPDLPNTITGAPPLFDALNARRSENVDRLLAAGARLDIRDRSGKTPLHQAALVNATVYIGKASGRERGCQYLKISVVAEHL